MSETRYTDQHEWIRVENGVGTVGISIFAAERLGDIVYVELPSPGKTVAAGKEAAVVESVKAASEVYSPASGDVVEINSALADDPARVNADPEGAAWFYKLRLSNPGETARLMTKGQYTDFIKDL